MQADMHASKICVCLRNLLPKMAKISEWGKTGNMTFAGGKEGTDSHRVCQGLAIYVQGHYHEELE